jgi:hypothetical protein
MPDKRIRILVDDHPILSEGIAAAIAVSLAWFLVQAVAQDCPLRPSPLR